ncbi:proline and serine-rich protein 2 [Lampris incognitus]|uniref:proline and serine-rich protein 2 n=1 Tax=Lampris incognitus TaxID=2546036 RepID=UPI0024B4A524|nr:proline and serine-rich protein 2 [Lampris incognitus]XP_056133275.1 proline and serine-rich protein 2 [Lampris incognitus]
MSRGQLTSDRVDMDVRLQASSQLRFSVNGGARRNSRPSEDEALLFLSREEQECILFFEETIDSLEESLVVEEEQRKQEAAPALASAPVAEVDGFPFLPSVVNPGPTASAPLPDRASTPKDQDIIDLVQPGPDLLQSKETAFDPIMPDFQSMAVTPDNHFEMRPRRDPADGLPSEYSPALPSSGYGSADGQPSYHPPGCIPTPVLIAQKLAENQGSAASGFCSSSSLRRRSLESDKPANYTPDHPAKHGPPTSVKPTCFPYNISVIHGSKEHHSQTLANVSIEERRAQMLANLMGTAHPFEQEVSYQAAPQKVRNIPTRSVSFRDPMPDKSRIEALSKLGLTRNRAMSGGTSLLISPGGATTPPATDMETGTKPAKTEVLDPNPDRKPETVQIHLANSPGDKPNQANPSLQGTAMHGSYHPPPFEGKQPVAPPPEVGSLDFNSYGGKTLVVNASASSKSEPLASGSSHSRNNNPPSPLSSPIDYNSYGGKTKVITSAHAPASRCDLPDILSSHIDKSRSFPPLAKPDTAVPFELNSYRGKTQTITPSASSAPALNSPAKTPKAPVPIPAPKPARQHASFSYPKAAAAAQLPSPEPRRRSTSKPSLFRSQGVTVQFSGKGATDESRREALRKLGLLKDTC